MPFRVNFPSLFMALIRAPTQATPYQAVFRVAPAMNKLEIREYLTKIYGLPVKKVGGWVDKVVVNHALLDYVARKSMPLNSSLNHISDITHRS